MSSAQLCNGQFLDEPRDASGLAVAPVVDAQEVQPPKPENDQSDSDNSGSQSDGAAANQTNRTQTQAQRSQADAQLIARGQAAFEQSCTQCHDADRALEKRKSRAGWLSTVRRMSRMEGADIAQADIEPIVAYLTSLNAPATSSGGPEAANGTAGAAADGEPTATDDSALSLGSNLSISGTVAPLWRGGNDNLENPDFFADVWLTADWQPDGPIRGRVTACTSCHSDASNGSGFTVELVEGSASLDLMHWTKQHDYRSGHCDLGMEAELKAGRFVVPFGAYAAMSHPGVYRTVTNPLIYNMGRQVLPNRERPPVLPMPYSDEGVDLDMRLSLTDECDATLDLYAVNGLQAGGPGVQFTRSRSYADNNSDPAIGGRATVGSKILRFGGSVMTGRMQDDMDTPLGYNLAGADVTGHLFDDLLRLYIEYAIRRNDSNFDDGQLTYGMVYEAEILLCSEPNLSALLRYDTLEHRDFFGDESIARFTWGLSTTSVAGSLFIVNHEHWNFDADQPDVDVLGCRWVVAF
jgi:hypothetical protein